MLAVVAIIALLLAILMPALRSARDQMKTLMCASNLRTAALRFQLYAEGLNDSTYQRKSVVELGPKRFRADDFQSMLYGAGDYWDGGTQEKVALNPRSQLMMCPAGPRELTKSPGPFAEKAITPPRNVSIGMNGRLNQAAVTDDSGFRVLADKIDTVVEVDVLRHPFVPLLFDVDGNQADDRDTSPHYSAPPPRGGGGPYTEAQWNPSKRHRGTMNVAFVGGHVQASRRPAGESWDWSYEASFRQRRSVSGQ